MVSLTLILRWKPFTDNGDYDRHHHDYLMDDTQKCETVRQLKSQDYATFVTSSLECEKVMEL